MSADNPQPNPDEVIHRANEIKAVHDIAVHEIEEVPKTKEWLATRLEELTKRAGEIALFGYDPLSAEGYGPNTDKDWVLTRLKERVDDVQAQSEQADERAIRHETNRKASLYEAREHLNANGGANREVYEQAAIEDATAAGKDVNFGGEHYPAQVPNPGKAPVGPEQQPPQG